MSQMIYNDEPTYTFHNFRSTHYAKNVKLQYLHATIMLKMESLGIVFLENKHVQLTKNDKEEEK